MVKTKKEEEVKLLSPEETEDFSLERDLGEEVKQRPKESKEKSGEGDEGDGLETVTLLDGEQRSEVDYQKRQDVCACLKTRTCAVLLGVLVLVSILGVQFRLYFLFYETYPGNESGHVALQTECGRLMGVKEDGLFVFKGIPYGKPPVGPLRWQPTATIENSNETCRNETKYADTYRPSCPTIQDGRFVGEEDCLYLNVWTPDLRPELPLPVIVWILAQPDLPQRLQFPHKPLAGTQHKAFFKAARQGKVTSHSLVASNATAVHVTFSYRQNVLGFLALGILSDMSAEVYSGNYGLHDQLAALRWVQENIADFGGDPDRVTLVGEGQAATHALCLVTSPLSSGLFQAVWLANVERMRFRPLLNSSMENINMLNSTGCRNASCLRHLTARQLLQAVPHRDHHFWFPPGKEKCSLTTTRTAQQAIDGVLLPASPWALLSDDTTTDERLSVAMGITGGCDMATGRGMNDTTLIKHLRGVARQHKVDSTEAINLYRRHDDGNVTTSAHDVCVSMATDLRYRCPFADLAVSMETHTGRPVSNTYISASAGDEGDEQEEEDSLWTTIFGGAHPDVRSLTLYYLLSAFARTGTFPERLLTSGDEAEDSENSVISPGDHYREEECSFWRNNLQ